MKDYTVSLTHDPDVLRQLADFWYVLVDENPHSSVFMNHAWMIAWWESFGSGRRLWLFQVRSQNGQLLGIVPLVEEDRIKGPISWRRLSLLGTDIVEPDHMNLIAHPDHEEAVAQAVIDTLSAHREEWETLYLAGIWPVAPIRRVLHKSGLDVRERENPPCPYTELPTDWETYYRETMGKDLRKKYRRYTNRLNRDYPDQVSFRAITDTQDLDRSLDLLAEHHQSRMNQKGMAYNAFQNEQLRSFHCSVAHQFFLNRWLHFHALSIGGRDIAFLYCFYYKNRIYDYQSGYDIEFGRYSPGHLITAHSIREAIRKGISEYDMLLGPEPYKSRYTDRARRDINIEVTSPSPQAKAVRAVRDQFHVAKDAARSVRDRLR